MFAVFQEMFGVPLFWGLVAAAVLVTLIYTAVLVRDRAVSWRKFLLAQVSMPVGAVAAVALLMAITNPSASDLGDPHRPDRSDRRCYSGRDRHGDPSVHRPVDAQPAEALKGDLLYPLWVVSNTLARRFVARWIVSTRRSSISSATSHWSVALSPSRWGQL